MGAISDLWQGPRFLHAHCRMLDKIPTAAWAPLHFLIMAGFDAFFHSYTSVVGAEILHFHCRVPMIMSQHFYSSVDGPLPNLFRRRWQANCTNWERR